MNPSPRDAVRMPESTVSPGGGHEVVLRGCTPTPLAAYLKALAILRLVAETPFDDGGDPEATGFWRDDVFVLRTRLTKDTLVDFFLEHYRPTPLIAPWNGASGFYEGDNVSGIVPLAKSNAGRFQGYRKAIETARQLVELLGLTERPGKEAKPHFLQHLRNCAPEALLRWMDAAVILSDEKLAFPPLLGTGGNDGHLDFTNNFMQRLGEVFDVTSGKPLITARTSLDTALFATLSTGLADRAIGQFSPGSAGGPNATSGFEAGARINTWDFILMLEGAVLFAASAARRLESADPAILVAPFTVRSRAGTAGSANANDDGDARGEIWMPLWHSPAGLEELRILFTEGRAAVSGRASRDGLDFARAVAQLGVDRGITSFQRYAFLMRSGKAFIATPLDRIRVQRNPDADLIANLERRNWLGSVQAYARNETAPNAFRSSARQLDNALFALTRQPGPGAFQLVLRQLGRIEASLALSPKSHEAVRTPVPPLDAAWAAKARDGSAEYNIAAALAGLQVRDEKGRRVLHVRRHLAPVSEPDSKGNRQWDPNSRSAVWNSGPLSQSLVTLLRRRQLDVDAIGAKGQPLASTTGATCADVAAFLEGRTNDTRIGELLAGLACVDLASPYVGDEDNKVDLLPAFALLKIFFTPEYILRLLRWLPTERSLYLPQDIAAHLAAGNLGKAVDIAWRRLRALGAKLPGRNPPNIVVPSQQRTRWLAALCIPLTYAETGRLLRRLDLTPNAVPAPPEDTVA